MSEEVYPLAILIDELKHEDVNTRLAAMKRLPTVALALGEERTRTELLPFLVDVAQEDEDEILTLLGEQIGELVPYVGPIEYAHLLFAPLSHLAVCEEPVVRDTAIASLNKIAEQIPVNDVIQYFVPLVSKLSTSEWFSSRIAASAIFAEAIKALLQVKNVQKESENETVKENFEQLLKSYSQLISDEAPMVRRAAGTHLPTIISLFKENFPTEIFLNMLNSLVKDEQDSVKLLSVDVAISLARADPLNVVPQIVDQIFGLLENRSWRVRYQAASRFGELAEIINLEPGTAEKSYSRLLTVFVALTDDAESEVKVSISKQVVDYAKNGLKREDLVERVMPCLENLTNDQSESVREALASKIAHLSPLLEQEGTVKYLLPLFLQMLRDELSEVRLQIISNLDVINEVIGIDRLGESLLPAISDLAKDKQWRVLLAVIDYSPLLAKQLGKDFFNQELVPLVISWLWDPVWAIRDAASTNLIELAKVFGVEWLETEIVPKLVNYQDINRGYLTRFTALLALRKIVSLLSVDVLVNSVLPVIIEMSEDPVANVRFNTAKTFPLITASIKSTKPDIVQSEILPIMDKLVADSDEDVQFFSTQALTEIQQHLA